MMTRSNKGLGLGGVLGALVAFGVVACGEDFEGDCKVNHRCPGGGGQSDGEGGSGASDTGDAGSGAKVSGGTSSGATGNLGAGQGGQDIAPVACTGPEECDDGDPNNGAETCGDDGMCAEGNAPPTVTSVSPEADAAMVETDAELVITFSEPLDAATVTENSVRLVNGNRPIEGEVTHVDGKVTFKPSAPLPLLAELSISIATTITDVDGAPLLEPYTSAFTTRDGSWTVDDAGSGSLYLPPDTLPMSANGDTLVSWISMAGNVHCPAKVRWYNSGIALLTPVKEYTHQDGVFECSNLAAGTNAEGVSAVAWREENAAQMLGQYRDGAWSTNGTLVADRNTSRNYAVAVAPNGAVSFLQQDAGSGTYARSSSPDGTWGDAVQNIALEYVGRGTPRFAFDSKSNGFAAWRAEKDGIDQVLVAAYTPADGWQAATAMPGSIAINNNTIYERGPAGIAVDGDGGAMAVWAREKGGDDEGEIMASRYTTAGGWGAPAPISGTLATTNVTDAPALVYDGDTYVAAWTAKEGSTLYTYTARYNTELDEWDAYEPRVNSAVLNRMPALGVDANQNLMMTWLKAAGTGQTAVVYARYDARAGEWSSALPVPEGVVKDDVMASGWSVPLGVAANGHAAIIWADASSQGALTKLRLASFH